MAVSPPVRAPRPMDLADGSSHLRSDSSWPVAPPMLDQQPIERSPAAQPAKA
jgi:hypothetical protein